MKNWLKRIRAALGLGVVWGLGWGLIGGFVMEAFIDPHGRIADMWPQGLAFTGFFGGVIFSIVLGVIEGRRRFDQLSLPRVGALGGIAGALLVLLGVALGLNLWPAVVLLGPVSLLSAASATGSVALARMASDRDLLGAVKRSADAQLE